MTMTRILRTPLPLLGAVGLYLLLGAMCLHGALPPLDADVREEPAPYRMTAGQTLTGRLAPESGRLADGSPYAFYLFQGRADETVVVTLRSAAFTPVLAAGAGAGAEYRTEVRGGGAAGAAEVRLVRNTGPDGTLGIWVNALEGDAEGAFELTVHLAPGTRLPDLPVAPLRSIGPGHLHEGRLTGESPVLGDGSSSEIFIYAGDPGDELMITLASDFFGTFLSTGALRGGTFHAETSDLARAGATRSHLRVVVGENGRFAIRVNALEPGEGGPFTLQIDRIAVSTAAAEAAPSGISGPDRRVPPGAGIWTIAAGNAAEPAEDVPAVRDRAFGTVCVPDPAAKPVRGAPRRQVCDGLLGAPVAPARRTT